MNINNDLSDFICVVDGVNYYNCIYAYQHKESMLAYIGQAKDYNRRDSQHLKSSKVVDGNDSTSFDAVYCNPDDWYRVIIHQDLPTGVLDVIEAQFIQEYGTYQATRGYNKTKGNLITVKKEKDSSKQLDLSGNIIVEKKVWDLDANLYSLNGTKSFATNKKNPVSAVEAHASQIPIITDDITDFYEPFCGSINISRYLANSGRLHDNLTLHLNDANKLNYYKLRAVKESPDELLAALHDYLPDNFMVHDDVYGVKDPLNPKRADIDNIVSKFRDDIKSTDLSVYSVELAAKLFAWSKYSRSLYYMVNDVTNQADAPLMVSRGYVCYLNVYNGDVIRKYNEFLNTVDIVLSCMDYKDMVFGNPESSIIYCDSPYPNESNRRTSNSSPTIDMGEYAAWLADLDVNGYCFTVSCSHSCLIRLQDAIRGFSSDARIENVYLQVKGNASKDMKLRDGVLKNHSRFIS